MMVFWSQRIVALITSFTAIISAVKCLSPENDWKESNREKRNGATDKSIDIKDQIFQRVEVLECTVTMAVIKSSSNLKYNN